MRDGKEVAFRGIAQNWERVLHRICLKAGGWNRSFAMIGHNYIPQRLLLPDAATAIMMAGAIEDANADFFSKP
jgi:hypothetical protein